MLLLCLCILDLPKVSAQSFVNEIRALQALVESKDNAIALTMGEKLLAKLATEDQHLQSQCYHWLGIAAYDLRKNNLADTYLHCSDSLQKLSCSPKCPLFAANQYQLGKLYYRKGEYSDSRKHFQIALQERLGYPQIDSLSTANTMSFLGKAANQMGEYALALELFDQARAMGMGFKGNSGFDATRSYLMTGAVHYQIDKYPKAISAFNTALDHERKREPVRSSLMMPLLNNLAATLDQLHEYGNAIQSYREALQFSRKIYGPEHTHTISIYGNIGLVYHRAGNFTMAEQFYNQAGEMAISSLGPADPYVSQLFGDHALFAFDSGNYEKALGLLQAAIYATAPIISRTDWKENPVLKDIIELQQFRNLIEFKATVLSKMAESASGQEKEMLLSLAIQCYDLFVTATDETWQIFSNSDDKLYLNRSGLSVYEKAIQCASRLHALQPDSSYLQKIFNYMERGKFQIMLEAIRQSQATNLAVIPASLKERVELLREGVYELTFQVHQPALPQDSATAIWNTLFELRLRLDKLTDSVKNAFPAYAQMTTKRPVPSLEELKNRFSNAETALIEYFMGDSSLFVLTGHPSGTQFRELKLMPGFRDSLRAFQDLLQSRQPNHQRLVRYQKLALLLYQSLLKPELEAMPSTVNRLRIIPDDLLCLLPFDALISGPGPDDPRSHAELPLLIYDYKISYAPSAALLASMRAQSTDGLSCLGFAWNSTEHDDNDGSRIINGQKWPGLPGTEIEIYDIEHKLEGKYFRGDAASEAQFKDLAEDYGLLHLALHGNSSGQEPFIVFPAKGDSVQDGILYLHELYNLNLQARLTVLSACETGTGTLARGEGVMSIASGFASAGCPSVLMSLWQVDDKAGCAIIRRFYQEVVLGASLDDALREAKLAYLKTSKSFQSAPSYWAPFILLGDTSPVNVLPRKTSNWLWIVGGIFALLFLMWIILKVRQKDR